MEKDNINLLDWYSDLEKILRDGAKKMMQELLEVEAEIYITKFKKLVDAHNNRLVKRNGYMPKREILTGIGPILVRKPRVRDARQGEKFTSHILPPYLRKIPSLDNLIPVLYLKGLSTGDFSTALSSILGPSYKGYSAKSVERLKSKWMEEYKLWAKRDLSKKKYVYIWADGIHFNVRLGDTTNKKICFLVIIGATSDGKKELLGVADGYRESTLSWKALLQDLSTQGLSYQPKLAIGDGALGFWAAIRETWPETEHQRCWVHKTANILDKMPKSTQPKAKKCIHDMYLAETRELALKAYDRFEFLYKELFPKAFKCLEKDKDNLFQFYNFPAVHWQHIRTTNPIESTFATVRLRSKKTKGCGSREASLMMVFKLCSEAEKRWKKLKGYKRIPEIIRGVTFVDGFTEEEWEVRKAA